MAGAKYVVVWPKARLTVNGKSKILERGEPVPNGVSDVDLDNLVSFGAIAGAGGLPEPTPQTPSEKGGGKEPSVKEILDEVGNDKEKAQAALAAEREARGDNARKTLVEPLEALLTAEAKS